MAPPESRLPEDNLMRADAFHPREWFDADVFFARIEDAVPAPGSNHAVRSAV